MSLHSKLFFAFLFVLLNVCDSRAQDSPSEIEWYESFFQENKQPVEAALGRVNDQLQDAIETHDLGKEAKIRKELGLLQLTRVHDYEKAMDCFIQALAIEDSLNLKKEQVTTYLAIAKVFEEAGNFQKSAEELDQALETNRQFDNKPMLVFILNKLGRIHSQMGHTEIAFDNYEAALKQSESIDEPGMKAEALFNLATLFTIQGKYSEALENHKAGLAIRRSIGDKNNEAASLNEIGELYRLMKNNEKALANHVVALEIRQTIGDKKGIAESFNNIGVLYYHQKNLQMAEANLQLGLEAARQTQSQDQIRKSYEFLSLCFKDAGDFQKALNYKESFVTINDFIQNDKNERQLVETQNRYVIDKKQLQIEKLESIRTQREKELATQKQFSYFLFGLIGLAVVVLMLIIYLYVVKRKSNKVLQIVNAKVQKQNLELVDLNATKDKFFSIISHDLKGPLNSLTSFSGLLINHTDSLSKDEIRMLAKDLDKSLKNLFALLENLLEWSRSQTGNIEFTPEAFGVNALLKQNVELLSTQAQNKKITIQQQGSGDITVRAHKHSVNTVVRNLISNAIKFTPEGGMITLASRQQNDGIMVSVSDTGVGMPKEVLQKLFRLDTKHTTKGTAEEKGTGLGLILCKEFIEKNGGRIWVESEVGKGSVFHFILPQSSVVHQSEFAAL